MTMMSTSSDINKTTRTTSTTSSVNSRHSAASVQLQGTAITNQHQGNANNSNTLTETGTNSTGFLSSVWAKMSEYVEMRTLETQSSVLSDSGSFSGSDFFDSGESVGDSSEVKRRPQRNGHHQPKEHRNSIWNYLFGGSSSAQADSKQPSGNSGSKSKPPSRKNSTTAATSEVHNRPRSSSYPSPPPPPSLFPQRLVNDSFSPTGAETEFAANGTHTWLEWNPLPDEDLSDDSDTSTIGEEELDDETDDLIQGTGEGHDFVPVLLNFTWCDKCAGVIWGFRQCLRCSYCKYTCHYKCLSDVRLDCTESPSYKESHSSESPKHTIVAIEDGVEDISSLSGLSRQELMWRIEEFNMTELEHPIKLESDSLIFVGSIRIHMNLSRPISIPSGTALPKVCSTLRPYDHSVDHCRRRTSFFLPKNVHEDIQIASESTAIQVIQGVLSHIQVIDNCRKFALFERTNEKGEVLMRKLADEDRPLLLRLLWGCDNKTKRYELRDNDSNQIEWEAFSVPELQNFLRILDMEEEDHVEQVRKKYSVYEKRLREAMIYID